MLYPVFFYIITVSVIFKTFHTWMTLNYNKYSWFFNILVPVISQTARLLSYSLCQFLSCYSRCLNFFWFHMDNNNNHYGIFISFFALSPNIFRFQNSANDRACYPFLCKFTKFFYMITMEVSLKGFHAFPLLNSNSWTRLFDIFIPIILQISFLFFA